jgi:hypothetical protein
MVIRAGQEDPVSGRGGGQAGRDTGPLTTQQRVSAEADRAERRRSYVRRFIAFAVAEAALGAEALTVTGLSLVGVISLGWVFSDFIAITAMASLTVRFAESSGLQPGLPARACPFFLCPVPPAVPCSCAELAADGPQHEPGWPGAQESRGDA